MYEKYDKKQVSYSNSEHNANYRAAEEFETVHATAVTYNGM